MQQNPLKLLRESAGLTQIQISQRTGVSATRLSLAENGLGVLTVEESQAVRQAILEACAKRSESVLALARKRQVVNVSESKSSVTGEKKTMKSLEQQLHEMKAELAAAKGQKNTTTATLKESFIASGMTEEDAEIAAAGRGKRHTIFEDADRR